jgi:hypothetical protein
MRIAAITGPPRPLRRGRFVPPGGTGRTPRVRR